MKDPSQVPNEMILRCTVVCLAGEVVMKPFQPLIKFCNYYKQEQKREDSIHFLFNPCMAKNALNVIFLLIKYRLLYFSYLIHINSKVEYD